MDVRDDEAVVEQEGKAKGRGREAWEVDEETSCGPLWDEMPFDGLARDYS